MACRRGTGGFDQRLADAGQESGEGHRASIGWPPCAIHAHEELTVSKIGTKEKDFEIFVAAIILDRNSQIWFHKAMLAVMVTKINHACGCASSLSQ